MVSHRVYEIDTLDQPVEITGRREGTELKVALIPPKALGRNCPVVGSTVVMPFFSGGLGRWVKSKAKIPCETAGLCLCVRQETERSQSLAVRLTK